MNNPPLVPPPPATQGGGQPPALPRLPLSPAATLAHLLEDGLVEADVHKVELYLSQQEFTLNKQPQSAQARAKYSQLFELGLGPGSTVAMEINRGSFSR